MILKNCNSGMQGDIGALLLKLVFVLMFSTVVFADGSLFSQSMIEKCAPALYSTRQSDTPKPLYLVLRDTAAFLSQLQSLSPRVPVTFVYAPANIAEVRISGKILFDNVIKWPEVLYADWVSKRAQEELPVPGHNLMINNVYGMHQQFPAFNGGGIAVSVKEKLFDTADIDLHGRVNPLRIGAKQFTTHATLMASQIAGAAISDPASQGVAPGAMVSASDFAVLLPDLPAEYDAQHITVQNHSYGVGIENYYGADALAYDQSVVMQPALLHVFSAGNLGDQSGTFGPYQDIPGFANLTGSFKMAKNVLVVGAVDSFGRVLSNSSRGPAYDGRLKPDLVAFGQDGSSGAAALVSGTAAVLQQIYAVKEAGLLPPAALLRAVLTNSAHDIDPPGPDFYSGFGNLDAANAAFALENGRYGIDSVSNQEKRTFMLTIPPGQALIKITLAWDDPAASPGSITALVNDLDLKLTGPDGQSIWLPWHLNTAAFPDSLRLPANRGRDSINTIEQVSVPFPVPGMYAVQVEGKRVSGNQRFAVAYEWRAADTLRWICPVRQSPLISGKAAVLLWNGEFPDTTGRLEYRMSGDDAWSLIAENVPLHQGYFRWTPPDTLARAQLRMLINGIAYAGDPFLLAPELRLHIGLNCRDSVLLYWDRKGQASQYQVWGLGSRYMEPLLVTADTFVLLNKSLFPQSHFAVSPYEQSGSEGWRSGAPQIDNQGVGCYFTAFLAEMRTTGQVDIQLSLGTAYSLSEVALERWAGQKFEPLQSWLTPFAGTQFNAIDSMPEPGVNRYRARINLNGGANLFSDTLRVYFTGNAPVRIYPNPVSGNDILRVLVQSPSEYLEFQIFNALGELILKKRMDEEWLEVPLPALPAGIYSFGLLQAEGFVSGGKLVVKP